MVKVALRTNNWSRVQPIKTKVKRLKDIKRDSVFIFYRLWSTLRRNRLLFWGGVVTFSTLLGASLALMTPLLSSRDFLNPKQRSSSQSAKFQSNFWQDGLQYQLSRPVNILLMGIDPDAGSGNTSQEMFASYSDTMLLLRLDPDDKSIKLLSIPGDSQVVVPGIGLAKISLANAEGGPVLAARTVSRALNNVPIDRYIRINTAALRELVELLGDVEVFVPQQMSYKDAAQKLQIDLASGWQTLNGEQAEQFARFRDSAIGDITRVQRQQLLLKALRDRLASPSIMLRLPQITRIMQNRVDTNLSREEMLALVYFSAQLEPENFQMVLLPGNLSALSQNPSSYWLDTVGLNRVMSEYFGVDTIGVNQARSLNTLRIAVQNASGEPNLSGRVAKYLQARGFNQVYTVSDWSDLQHQTEIIVQKGNLAAAADLKNILGLGSIEANSTGDLESHLTVRVGKDWMEN